MVDWVTVILETPYILIPVFIWLWERAGLEHVEWNRISAGVLMTLAGNVMRTLSMRLATYASMNWMYWPITFSSLLGTLSSVAGLMLIGVYLTYYAVKIWRI